MQDDERDDDADDEEGRRDEGRGPEALYRKEGDRVVPAPADGRENVDAGERRYEDGRAVGTRFLPPAAQSRDRRTGYAMVKKNIMAQFFRT